jgi:hypothetical protein
MAVAPFTKPDPLILNKESFKTGQMGFSGCDISATIRVPAYSRAGIRGVEQLSSEKVFRIGTLQTISISTYNSKTPVKALGFKNPIAIARGGRTIAGTMIFNQLHKHVLDENDYGYWQLHEDKGGMLTYSSGNMDYYIKNQNATDKLKADMQAISDTGDLENYAARRGAIDGGTDEVEKQSRISLEKFKKIKSPTDIDKQNFENERIALQERLAEIRGTEDEEMIRLTDQYNQYHYLRDLLEGIVKDKEYARKEWDFSWDGPQIGDKLKPSDVLPFDIIILLFNEAGNMGKIILYGVEIVHDSQTLSVEDVYTEVQYQYIARDIVYFEDIYDKSGDFNFINARGRTIKSPSMKVAEIKELTPVPIVTKEGLAAEAELLRNQVIAGDPASAVAITQEADRVERIAEIEDELVTMQKADGASLRKARADYLSQLNKTTNPGDIFKPNSASLLPQYETTYIDPNDYESTEAYQLAVAQAQSKKKVDYWAEREKFAKESEAAFDALMKQFEEFDK